MKKTLIFISIVLFLVLSSCGTTDKKETNNIIKQEFDGAPRWVIGNASTSSQICGVGSAANSGNLTAMRIYAQNRGRTEISKILVTKVSAVLIDYFSKTISRNESHKSISSERQIEDISKQITDSVLSGTEQKDLWTSNSGTLYILMCTDIEKFKDSVKNMSRISENIRNTVTETAATVFDEISKGTEIQNNPDI